MLDRYIYVSPVVFRSVGCSERALVQELSFVSRQVKVVLIQGRNCFRGIL